MIIIKYNENSLVYNFELCEIYCSDLVNKYVSHIYTFQLIALGFLSQQEW